MKPPAWQAFPPAEAFARLYLAAPSSAIEAARANARAIGLMVRSAGLNVDALPLLDVRQEGANDIIGDRALGSEPMQVAALGRAVLDGLGSAGVVGIIKHIPGHGRALVDSHKELPVVPASADELQVDLEPFDGIVAQVNIDPGDPSSTSGQVPMYVIDISKLHIDASVSDVDIGRIAVGQAVQVGVDVGTDKTYTGKVSYIAPAATISGNIRTYLVRVVLDDQTGLRPGMSAYLEWPR